MVSPFLDCLSWERRWTLFGFLVMILVYCLLSQGLGPATQLVVDVIPRSSFSGPESPQAGEGARILLWWGGHEGAVALALLLWRSQVGVVQGLPVGRALVSQIL